jgi:hypothetical protein
MSRKNKDGIYLNYDKIICDRYMFEGTAERVKDYIDEIVEKAKEKGMVGEGLFDFSINNGFYDYEFDLTVVYEFDRVETEKEKATREKAEAKRKEAAEKKRKETAEKKKLKADAEYAEFLRLKEKFGVFEK